MSLMLFDLMKMRYDDKTVFYVQTISGIRNTAAHRSAYQNKLNYVTYFLFRLILLSMMSSSVCQSSEEFKNLHTTMAAISICVLSTSFFPWFVFVWADIWAWLVTVRTGWLRLLPGAGWEPGLHIFSDCWRSSVMAWHGHMDMGDTMLSWYHNMSRPGPGTHQGSDVISLKACLCWRAFSWYADSGYRHFTLQPGFPVISRPRAELQSGPTLLNYCDKVI